MVTAVSSPGSIYPGFGPWSVLFYSFEVSSSPRQDVVLYKMAIQESGPNREVPVVYACRKCWAIIPYLECPHNCPGQMKMMEMKRLR